MTCLGPNRLYDIPIQILPIICDLYSFAVNPALAHS